ncbi:MAG TPA: DUF1963 domain-containing protein, partial [Planctomycetaceae bacterium]|nr:DUF1963 domain-containing protein [Planctomycetaceae bacterium]
MEKVDAEALVRASGLSAEVEIILDQLLPSARIVVDGDGGTEDSFVSHFGGVPWLPADEAWPRWDKRGYLEAEIARLEERFRNNPRLTGARDSAARMRQEISADTIPLPFLAQLSLEELSRVAPLPNCPSDGTLAFFCDPSVWGFDPIARGFCRVLFFPPHTKLRRASAPEDLPKEARYPERRLSFKREWTLPTRIYTSEINLSIWSSEEYNILCQRLMPGVPGKESVHRCGGHPQEIQDEMRLTCQ